MVMRMIMMRTAWTQMLCKIRSIPDTYDFMLIHCVCGRVKSPYLFARKYTHPSKKKVTTLDFKICLDLPWRRVKNVFLLIFTFILTVVTTPPCMFEGNLDKSHRQFNSHDPLLLAGVFSP